MTGSSTVENFATNNIEVYGFNTANGAVTSAHQNRFDVDNSAPSYIVQVRLQENNSASEWYTTTSTTGLPVNITGTHDIRIVSNDTIDDPGATVSLSYTYLLAGTVTLGAT